MSLETHVIIAQCKRGRKECGTAMKLNGIISFKLSLKHWSMNRIYLVSTSIKTNQAIL